MKSSVNDHDGICLTVINEAYHLIYLKDEN